MTLVLETLGSDKTLDAGSFGVWLLAFALGLDFAADDEFADLFQHQNQRRLPSSLNRPCQMSTHIILLAQAKEFPDFCRSLWSQSLRVYSVGQPRDLLISLLHNTERQNTQVHPHNAAPNTLSPPLASPSRSVTRVAGAEQQSNTGRMHDALLHRKTLLVVTSGDFENVAFELWTDGVTRDFLTHAAFHEDAEFALIVDFDELLGAV